MTDIMNTQTEEATMSTDNDNSDANEVLDQPTVDETPAQAFKRIASRRLTNVVKAIHVLGNCSASTYEYTDEQVAAIEQHINTAKDAILKKFRKEPTKNINIEL